MSSYDTFAWLYDRYWAAPFQQWEMPALETMSLAHLKPGAPVLDLCCGVGHLARALAGRGFSVTGVDSSEGMLEVARENAPTACFTRQNATDFYVSSPVDAVFCTFDSINHLQSTEALLSSFRRVFRSLKPDGIFLFDFNTIEAYGPRWDSTYNVTEPDHVFFLRGHFDPVALLGHTEITMFRQYSGTWIRNDAKFSQRPWDVSHLTVLLNQAGFQKVEFKRAAEDLGLEGHYGLGRVYIRAC